MGLFSSITDAISDVGDAITGGLGTVISGGLGLLGSSNTNSAAAANVASQEAYQTQMSDTSYQRAVADMRAAGLNPMLAYTQGGASTPSGAVAPVQNVIQSGVNSAQSTATTLAELDNLKAQNSQIVSQTALNRANTLKAAADTQLSTNNAATAAANAAITAAQVPSAQNQAAFDSSTAGKVSTWFNNIMESLGHLNPFTSSAKNVHSMLNSAP